MLWPPGEPTPKEPPGLLVSVLGPVAAGRAEDAMTPVAQQLLRVLLATLAKLGFLAEPASGGRPGD